MVQAPLGTTGIKWKCKFREDRHEPQARTSDAHYSPGTLAQRQHPLARNRIAPPSPWRHVEPADSGARFKITLNRVEAFLHHPHNSNTCSKTDIKQLREVLTHAGVTLSSYEAGSEDQVALT